MCVQLLSTVVPASLKIRAIIMSRCAGKRVYNSQGCHPHGISVPLESVGSSISDNSAGLIASTRADLLARLDLGRWRPLCARARPRTAAERARVRGWRGSWMPWTPSVMMSSSSWDGILRMALEPAAAGVLVSVLCCASGADTVLLRRGGCCWLPPRSLASAGGRRFTHARTRTTEHQHHAPYELCTSRGTRANAIAKRQQQSSCLSCLCGGCCAWPHNTGGLTACRAWPHNYEPYRILTERFAAHFCSVPREAKG